MQQLKRTVDENHETIQEKVKYLKNELNITKISTDEKIEGYLSLEDTFKEELSLKVYFLVMSACKRQSKFHHPNNI